jgi:serine/threonine protein kinase
MEKGVFSGRIIQTYEVCELIGKGGQGEVYRCLHTVLKQERAVKLLRLSMADEDSIARFKEREIRAQASLKHDNIIQAIDWIEEPEIGVYGIVMEYLPGENLKTCIQKEGAFSVQRALDIAIQVGKALSYAHQHGIIHRDVKSANILMKDRNNVKLTDFGIARIAFADKLTRTRFMLGTVEYMSPEQIRGEKEIDARTDIYSLAIVIYEMLTGTLPFTGETDFTIQEKQLKSKPVALRKISRELKAYIPQLLDQNLMRALEKKAERRHISMNSFVRELEICFSPEIKDYYEQAVAAFDREDYCKAVEFFGKVKAIDSQYEEVNAYYDKAVELSEKSGKKEIKTFNFTGKIIGGYEICECIGRGGQGAVYRCRHIQSQQERAVKLLRTAFLDDSALKRFKEREANLQMSLNHDNIVKAFDWIEEPEIDVYGIVMEYLPGGNLKERIKKEGFFGVQKALDIAIQIADALNYAHQNKVIHRDVKANNILIHDSCSAKLADFGIARLLSADNFTRTRLIMGTVEYMSPEQIRGDKDIDGRTDIYSLAIVLYEMLTGALPFTGNSEHTIQEKHLKKRPVAPRKLNRNIPPLLESAIMQALKKAPSQRPVNMDLFMQQMKNSFVPAVKEFYREGIRAFEKGEYKQAVSLFNKVLDIDSRYERVSYYLDILKKDISNEETRIIVQNKLNEVKNLQNQGNYAAALKKLKETQLLTPDNIEATELYEETILLLQGKRQSTRKRVVVTALSATFAAGVFLFFNIYMPEHTLYHKFSGYVNAGKYAQAIEYYEETIEGRDFRLKNRAEKMSQTAESLIKEKQSIVDDVLKDMKNDQWPDDNLIEVLKSFYPDHAVIKLNAAVKQVNLIWDDYKFPPGKGYEFTEAKTISEKLKESIEIKDETLNKYLKNLNEKVNRNAEIERAALRFYPGKISGNPPSGIHPELSARYDEIVMVDLTAQIILLKRLLSDPNAGPAQLRRVCSGAKYLLQTYRNRISSGHLREIEEVRNRAIQGLAIFGESTDCRPINIF